MTKFNTESAELHMGILQNRLHRLKGQMNACALRMNQEEDKTIDKESEELKFNQFNQRHEEIDKELVAYEDKVLKLTEL